MTAAALMELGIYELWLKWDDLRMLGEIVARCHVFPCVWHI